MKVTFNFTEKFMHVVSSGTNYSVPLNHLALFLIANLIVTLTWLVPSDKKSEFINDLQDAVDNADPITKEQVDNLKSNNNE